MGPVPMYCAAICLGLCKTNPDTVVTSSTCNAHTSAGLSMANCVLELSS